MAAYVAPLPRREWIEPACRECFALAHPSRIVPRDDASRWSGEVRGHCVECGDFVSEHNGNEGGWVHAPAIADPTAEHEASARWAGERW